MRAAPAAQKTGAVAKSGGRHPVVRAAIALATVLALFIVGLVLGVFGTFLVVFSDKHSQSDYVLGVLMVGAEFLVVAGIAALVLRSWRYPFVLAIPSLLILWWYSTRETDKIQFHMVVLAALMIGTVLGALSGYAIRARRRGA